ncbi:MAG: phosphate ABC transporter, permease protein PstA [Marinilabiliales bacterium]|nr:MAG: phosphate ABC transporter, permease protein PstA [Marinilabiliales bacterium]
MTARPIKNSIFKGAVIVFSLIAITPILLIIYELVRKGYKQINISFFTEVAPSTWDAMMANNNGELIPGGILNGITGTLLMVFVASIIAIPIGLITGIYLYENAGKRYANVIRSISDILQGSPSIVIGIIGYFWVVKYITNGFSALAGSVALAIMMLPLIIRSTEETLKMIPQTIKEAGLALGVPYHKIIMRVLIPTSFSGLVTGILLALSRVIGETAPLLITALGSPMVNFNLDKPASAVPLLIWEFYNDPNMVNLIWSSSLFLVVFILTMNLISKKIAPKKN